MNILRYVIAVMLLVAIPAAICYWLLIHPLVRFWRRLGSKIAYSLICVIIACVMTGMYLLSDSLLACDFGGSIPLAGLGLVFLLLSGWLLRLLRKHLSLSALIGVPELNSGNVPGQLITNGIYARIRHPRYVQMTLALLGYALIANYPAVYLAWICWIVGIIAVVLLEERELAVRFGPAYRDYCRRVPRFVPTFRHPSAERH